MKQPMLILSAILFGALFYKQDIGLNLSLFSLLTIAILYISNRDSMKNRSVLIHLVIYVMTAIFVFLNNSLLAILSNIVAFFTLVGSISHSFNSIYIYWLNGAYTSIAGFFHRNFDLASTQSQEHPKEKIDIWHWAKMIGIPIAAIFIFIWLYQEGNPVFKNLIAKVNFDYLNSQWLLFCLLGYYLFSNVYKPVKIEEITTHDALTRNSLNPSKQIDPERLLKEKQLGTLLLGLLNSLIVLYLITDIIYLSQGETGHTITLTDKVHNGVYALIASIIIAIVIILFFFRGDLNFFKQNRFLKNLSYSWIFLNTLLVITIFIKNGEYVFNYGLTYKRIGVYVYLILTLIGLSATFIKVLQIKNLWYLIRLNTKAVFLILIISSSINWDSLITSHNIKHAQVLDVEYLLNLSDNNAMILNHYKDRVPLEPSIKKQISLKYQDFIFKVDQRNWQEFSYDNLRLNNSYKN